jgi:O-antigen/teichoic acid export membrane protein
MALFAAANSLRILVLFVPSILNNVSLSLLNHQRGAGDESRYRRLFWVTLGLTASLVAVSGLAVVIGGSWLLGIFGHDFRAGYSTLVILMLSTMPETLSIAMLQILQSRERMWLSFLGFVLPSYVALVVLARLLTPTLGAQGLAWSYLAAMTVAMAGSVIIVSRLGIWDRNVVPVPAGTR